MNDATSTFDYRNFTDHLIPTKTKNKFHCPVCDGNDFSINQETGAAKCWHGCEPREVREAIRPLKEFLEEQRQQNPDHRVINASLAKKPTPSQKPAALSPAPLPQGKLAIARLSEVPSDVPQPAPAEVIKYIREALQGCSVDEIKQTTVTVYDHGNGKKVRRFEAPCSESVKGHKKTFVVSHVNDLGETVCKKGNDAWSAYRQDEAVASALSVEAGSTPVVLVHEGQKCVEAGRSQKLAGISAQGTPSEKEWIHILSEMKLGIGERQFILAYCQDNDDTGAGKAEKLVEAAKKAQVPVIVIDLLKIDPNLCIKGDIEQVLSSGMDGDQLAQLILEQIHEMQAQVNNIQEEDLGSFDDTLNPDVEFIQKITNFLYGDKPWISADDKLYQWEGNHYRYSPDSVERPKVASFCNSYVICVETKNGFKKTYPYAKPSKVEEVLKWVKMRFEKDPRSLNPPGVNCTNGVIQVKWEKGKPVRHLEQHDPTKHYYVYEPLVKYDPEADPTDCERLLQCLDKPQQQILLRNLGASIDLPEVRKRRGREVKILLACGLGSNGKDALRQTVSIIFGHQGMTSVSLADFSHYDEGKKFALAPLINSRVNWASENPATTRLDKIQALKLFATGNKLHSERKGKDHIEFTPEAVGIFNLNDVPALQGTIQAIQDRIAPLEFRKTFKINPDPNNPDELQADPRFAYDEDFVQTNVAPAFLNKMLDGLEALITDGIDYECTTEAFKSMQKENNHLFQFCEDAELDYAANSSMTAMEIWEKLEVWYQDNGTLTIEDNGRRIWADQVRPSDHNVKAINQVIARFKQIFPKATLVTIPHASGKRMVQALKGIGIITHSNDPFSISEFTTAISENPTPVPHQLPHQQTLVNQDLHTTHTSFTNERENEKNDDEKNILLANNEKEEEKSSKLVWVVCDEAIPTVPAILTGVETGVEETQTGVEDAENIRIALNDENAGDMLYVLLSGWSTERKEAARAHLTPDQVNTVRSYVNRPLKPLSFTFKAGDRIKCYPTLTDADKRREVTATVLDVEVERGYFKGCTVEYLDKNNEQLTARIAGGSSDWILRKI